ncbi:cellulose binding domain-containing protein [Micromonospora inyonensis]|uniref:cellulose binding domain-containing protein n=1 Tax=Micromonospora inyonensis TaxID=47866 RepID=UPI00316ADFB8
MTAGTSAIRDWAVVWTFADGQSVTQSWNATVTSSGPTVVARNRAAGGTAARLRSRRPTSAHG